MSGLTPFFRPRSVALVGASRSSAKLGGVVLTNLKRFGGPVYPVNPKQQRLMGMRSYASASDLPGSVDLCLILRPAEEVPAILRELQGKTRHAVVMSAGFAESGETALQKRVLTEAARAGIRILGPNCMGIFNPHHRLDTLFVSEERLMRPGKGGIAVVSQSGAMLSCVLNSAAGMMAGLSLAVGYGNAADVNEAEIFDWLAEDRKTEVVISYLESLGNGRRFLEAAERLSKKKRFLVLRAGKAGRAPAAAHSHTGRLAGRYDIFRSVMDRFGIREAEDFDTLMDGMKALSLQPPATGERICIVTNGGGWGVLAADECSRRNLQVPLLTGAHRKRLRQVFPHFYGIDNPIDLTAQVRDEDYATVVRELDGDFDGFVMLALPNVLGITEDLGRQLAEARTGSTKPLVFGLAEGGISAALVRRLERIRVPVYPSPERAVRALGILLERRRR